MLEKMLELLDSFRKYLVNLHTPKHPDNTPRKRRASRDVNTSPSKMRRLDDFTMPHCSSPIQNIDTPSGSKSIFKKPFFPTNKSFFRPTDIIDISDDEDNEYRPQRSSHSSNEESNDFSSNYWEKSNFYNRFKSHEQRHRNVLQKAKNSIAKTNAFTSRFKKPTSSLNESIRIGDYNRYKEMLDSFSKPTRSLPFSNGIGKKLKNDKPEKVLSFAEICIKKHNEFFIPKVIDLTNDVQKDKTISIDSDSDSEVKIIGQKVLSPVNSLRKRLEIEPVTDENWIKEWEQNYARKFEERKKLIAEEEIRRNEFRNVNKVNAQFRLEESLKNCLRIQEVVLLDEEPEEKLELPVLNADQERIINQALRPGPAQQVFVDKYNLRITRADLQTLRGLNWLNDEVINFYTNLISERGNGSNPKLPKVHSMNTFFYPKLINQGYSTLRRWTKRVDIFAQDLIVIPVHLGVHWCLSIIDFRDKTIKYYDSMGSPNQQCLKALLEYLKQEHLDKKKSEFDVSNWKTTSVRDLPQQMNGSDCGMFACMYAEFISRNAKILFTQEHMPFFRKKMVYEIVSGELLMK